MLQRGKRDKAAGELSAKAEEAAAKHRSAEKEKRGCHLCWNTSGGAVLASLKHVWSCGAYSR